MKKFLIVLIVVAIGIIFLVLGSKNNIDAQPALVAREDRFYCTVNNNGTITYGTQRWVGWWIFGHWEANPGAITMPGGAQQCAAFLEGVNAV